MKAEIAEASGIFFFADSTFSSDDGTSDLGTTAAVEFEGFLAITLKLQSRLKHILREGNLIKTRKISTHLEQLTSLTFACTFQTADCFLLEHCKSQMKKEQNQLSKHFGAAVVHTVYTHIMEEKGKTI